MQERSGKDLDNMCVCGHTAQYHSGGYGDCMTPSGCDCRSFDDDYPEVAAAESDEQWVKARYPEAVACGYHDNFSTKVINIDGCAIGFGNSFELAWSDALRRLEPKPDAEAIFCPDPDCVYPAGHESDHSPSAQPKPDAAGEAKEAESWRVEYRPFHNPDRWERYIPSKPIESLATAKAHAKELCGFFHSPEARIIHTREITTILDPLALSEPRNSALADAAKGMAEALEKSDGTLHKFQVSSYDSSRLEIRAALARFRALGGE